VPSLKKSIPTRRISPTSGNYNYLKQQLVYITLQEKENSEFDAFPWEDALPADDNAEETLLRLHLSVKEDDNNNVDMETALDQVQKYTQSFPFAAVLPVQPLQYLPTHDGGVDVLFLRKKTKEKGSVDGGMRFFVRPDPSGGIDILVKRNSKGQVISKMFTEKLVVQSFVQGISGENDEKTGKAPTDLVSVQSVFHPWL